MNFRFASLHLALATALAVLPAAPAHASLRSSLFGRNSRAMMGMSDGATGELYTITPGVRGLSAQLRRIGSVGYGRAGNGFNMTFASNGLPRSIRGINGSRMTLVRIPGTGGGMRGLIRTLQGVRAGSVSIFPGSGAAAERATRGTIGSGGSFRFTGFDGFRFNRQQILNDVPVFGPVLAQLLNSGFGSINDLLQALSAAILAPDTGIPDDPDLISDLINTAAGDTISVFDPSSRAGLAQEININPVDPLEYLRSLLNLLPTNVARRLERLLNNNLIAELLRPDSPLGAEISDLLTGLNDPSIDPPDFYGLDPASPGTIEFIDNRIAVIENAGSGFIYLTRQDGALGDVSATVTLDAGGTAVPGADFRFRTQTVTWRHGEAGPRAVSFSVINDNAENGDVEFHISIESISGGASPGSLSGATIVIVDDDGPGGVAVARNPALVLEYSWPRSKRDLDTSTTFLGETVGYNLGSSSEYMFWTGDDVTDGGREIVVVDIDRAVENGDLPSSVAIDCAADWYEDARGFGPATLSVYFREKFSPTVFRRVSAPIAPQPVNPGDFYPHPNVQPFATTPVATVTVNHDDDAGFFSFHISN